MIHGAVRRIQERQISSRVARVQDKYISFRVTHRAVRRVQKILKNKYHSARAHFSCTRKFRAENDGVVARTVMSGYLKANIS